MATLIYSFEHPNDKQTYFYTENTFYGAIESIPMDLANFIWYFQLNKNNLIGFNEIYSKLKAHGSYSINDSFSSKSKEEKEMLYALVMHTGSNEMAKLNQPISDQLDHYLLNNEDEDVLFHVAAILRKGKYNAYKPYSFFVSWHSVYNYFFENHITESENFSLNNLMLHEKKSDLVAYASYFIDLVQNFDMPISAIPHVLRTVDIVRNYLIENKAHDLLPFQASQVLQEKKVYKFSKKEPNDAEINSFYSAVENCNYGIASSLKEAAENRNNVANELTPLEKKEILKSILFDDVKLANLLDESGNDLLPSIYTDPFYSQINSDGPYILFKYGIQTMDLYSKYGKLLYQEAYDFTLSMPYVFVTEHSMELKIMKYSEEEDMLYLMDQFRDNSIYSSSLLGTKSEDKMFFRNGFINEDFEMQSPFCFATMRAIDENEKCYSEGLSPVSLNGKWGFIDHASNCVIPFEFGDAFPFKDGKAKVFKLNEEFRKEFGEWRDVPSYETHIERYQMTEEEFQLRFPAFPSIVRKPLGKIRKRNLDTLQLAMDYHCFENGLKELEYEKLDISYFGKWITIDKTGNEIEEELITISDKELKSIPATYVFENKNSDYWIQKLTRHKYEVTNLPDSLYLDKKFILELISKCPEVFDLLPEFYSNDIDCKFTFEEAYKKTNSVNTANSSSTNLIADEDDLPF